MEMVNRTLKSRAHFASLSVSRGDLTLDKVFSRGTPAILQGNGNSPGIFVGSMAYAGSTAIVVTGTSDTNPRSARLRPRFGTI
jgi:hypothetical protein